MGFKDSVAVALGPNSSSSLAIMGVGVVEDGAIIKKSVGSIVSALVIPGISVEVTVDVAAADDGAISGSAVNTNEASNRSRVVSPEATIPRASSTSEPAAVADKVPRALRLI